MSLSTSTSTRTVVADLARLIKENKISTEELAQVDKNLLSDAQAYAATLDIGMIDLQSLRQGNVATVKKEVVVAPSPKPRIPFAQQVVEKKPQPSAYTAYSEARFTPPTKSKTSTSAATSSKPHFASPVKIPEFKKEKTDFSKLKEELEQELENSASTPDDIVVTKKIPEVTAQKKSTEDNTISIPKPLTQDEILEHEKKDLEKKVQLISLQEKKAYEEVAVSESKVKDNLQYFSSILEKEKEFENRENDIRKRQESASTLKERKVIEEERWIIEDERRKVEENRWQKDQEKKTFEKELSDKKDQAIALSKKREDATKEFEKIKIKKEASIARQDIAVYQAKLLEVESTKKKGEVDWQAQQQAGIKAKNDLELNTQRVKELNTRIMMIEVEEKKAASEEIRHIYEEKRWAAENEMRDIEKAGWQLEESTEAMETSKQTLLIKFAELQIEEEALKIKVSELEQAIKKAL